MGGGKIIPTASRGYLGPLGDDFPAIFPIALGLMLFFSAITLTYDYYTEKRNAALLIEANVALAKAARSQLVFSKEYWGDDTSGMCALVDRTKANYGVRAKLELKKHDPGVPVETIEFIPRLTSSPFNDRLYENPCVDTEDEYGDSIPYETDFFISLVYPVLIEAETGNELATLVVTTWT
ncbi:hypothetical protein ACFLQ2_00880 [archaeon]